MGAGLARGAKASGVRVAFGDGRRIIWDQHSPEIFKRNPNIAAPGDERAGDLRWVNYYKGNRIYNQQDASQQRWIWNLDWRPIPGEVFFSTLELQRAGQVGDDFVVIEPNVPWWKSVAPNKDWGKAKYQAVADRLKARGLRVVQFVNPKSNIRLRGVETRLSASFRDGLAMLKRAKLFIGPEGGMHHGAAAVGVPAVVLFGGFIPPSVTGYDDHANLTGGAEACGRYTPCDHCREAMAAIGVEEVVGAALARL
ncbi:MAG: glycosyltransferase family 9 protein [Hyphomonadaceae bacterium]|nr:glycosyltransferase family 9 protein [Hyphomonadaceae bacterium]